jgi:hypothetical protein
MNSGVPKKQAAWLLVCFFAAGLALVLYLAFRQRAYDDPFITYRYANNLAHGVGFVYNPGERVLSTTTPLFTLLLAALALLPVDLPHLALALGAAGLALCGIFLWDLGRSWKTPAAGWAGLLLLPSFPLLITTLGSETPLYLALCTGAFAFYARRRYAWTAVFAALATLTRPDGILVPALLGAHFVGTHLNLKNPGNLARLIPWKALLAFVLLVAPWFIFAWVYFGSPLPVTLAAKQYQGAMATSVKFLPGFLAMVRLYGSNWHYQSAAAVALLGAANLFWKGRAWLLLLGWPAIYFVAYVALGVSGYFWYYAPLALAFIVLTGLGIDLVARTTLKALRRPAQALALVLVVGLAFLQAQDLAQLRLQPEGRERIYRATGEWLAENTPPQAWVATLEVGIIGFYAQRPMIDFAGLLQPDVARQLDSLKTYAAAASWAVQHFRPSYLVLHQGSFPDLETGYVPQNCRMVKQFKGADYGYDSNLDIYACR